MIRFCCHTLLGLLPIVYMFSSWPLVFLVEVGFADTHTPQSVVVQIPSSESPICYEPDSNSPDIFPNARFDSPDASEDDIPYLYQAVADMMDVIDAMLKADPSVAPNKDGFERYFLARQADDVKRINPSDRAEIFFLSESKSLLPQRARTLSGLQAFNKSRLRIIGVQVMGEKFLVEAFNTGLRGTDQNVKVYDIGSGGLFEKACPNIK